MSILHAAVLFYLLLVLCLPAVCEGFVGFLVVSYISVGYFFIVFLCMCARAHMQLATLSAFWKTESWSAKAYSNNLHNL